jgi:predicted dehydrogenase
MQMRSESSLSRRRFLQQLGVGAVAAPFITSGWMRSAPNSRLLHASFGASGMAWADLTSITRHPAVTLAAVADVDLTRTGQVREQFPDARIYQDWRELLDREQELDTVNVSTPDHMHAPIAMSALQLGKHVYCEKPLTHNIYESRQLTEVARRRGLVTQMGIQIHSASEYQTAVQRIQQLRIGKITEVHTWSGKKWGDPGAMPQRTDPVPEGLDWDQWVGVAAMRPFIGDGWYHPGNWRKRLDFGTGTFGDMGCHIYDPVFAALALTAPISVRSEGPAPNDHSWAIDARIEYVFPGTPFTEGRTVKVTWYDGDQRPGPDITRVLGELLVPDQGSIFLGTQGAMLLPHIGRPVLLPEADHDNDRLPRVPGDDHWRQFVEAVLGNGTTLTKFDYSGPLTEAVLLGSLATRFPQTTLQWDAAKLRFTNLREANQFVRSTYRKGWAVKGL